MDVFESSCLAGTHIQSMTSLHFTTAVLGLGLAAIILLLVRRSHLHLSHGVFWLGVAVLAAVFGLWPGFVDQLATVAGISYSPALILLVAIIVLLVKSLLIDITNTRIERQLRRLNQRLTIEKVERERE